MKYFEDFIKGSFYFSPKAYEVTEEEIIEVASRWDPQTFHIDPERAKETIFGGLVASTAHMFAIYSWLGNTQREKEEIATVSSLGYKSMQWHFPVRPGSRPCRRRGCQRRRHCQRRRRGLPDLLCIQRRAGARLSIDNLLVGRRWCPGRRQLCRGALYIRRPSRKIG